MQYIHELINEFGRPYCKDERVLYVLETTLQRADEYIEQQQPTISEEERESTFRSLFKVVQVANRDVMEDNNQLPHQHNWETDYPELWSPIIDFVATIPTINDTDRKIYMDDLSALVCRSFPQLLPQPYGFTSVELAVITYDIWLQAVCISKDPYNALKGITEELVF